MAKVVSATLLLKRVERPFVYEYLKPVAKEGQSGEGVGYGVSGLGRSVGSAHAEGEGTRVELYEADTGPRPILLWRPPSSAAELARVEGDRRLS